LIGKSFLTPLRRKKKIGKQAEREKLAFEK